MIQKNFPAKFINMGLVLLSLVACKGPDTMPAVIPTESPSQVAEDKNLVFATILQPEIKEQFLDVYSPEEEGVWPVVVFLHHAEGNKEGYILLSQAIADKGVVVFTINWPVWLNDMAIKENGKGFREMNEVISCAIRFARATAADYQGDPSQVTLVGHSYGAGNGAWIALGSDKLEGMWEDYAIIHGGPPSQVECAESLASDQIDAFVGIAGPYHWNDKFKESDPDLWKIVSPYAFLDQSLDLPIRLIHGERDDYVNIDVSVQFKDALLAAGFDTRLILHDGSHMVPIELTTSVVMEVIETIGN
jgi:acetyl esterase/lipase